MIKMKNSLRNIVLLAAMTLALALQAQPKDKILNRLYADLKRLHFGFSVGTSFQNLSITNNGFVTDNGESWYVECLLLLCVGEFLYDEVEQVACARACRGGYGLRLSETEAVEL